MTDAAQPTLKELVQLGAVDTEFFNRTFFPRAARLASPSFAPRLNAALENPRHRLLNLRVFRGGTKTTRLRMFGAKRAAYGISRTILYVGASEDHAVRSIQWMRGQIEEKLGKDGTLRRPPLAEAFDLRLEKKGEAEIRIFHGIDTHPIWLLGVGITGNIRGINFDDYRPDLILLDDVLTDESAATAAQREKISTLIMGAVKNSLISAVEEPNAKLVMLQTPLDDDDASGRAARSEEWHTESFGCWTPETEDAPIDEQISSWPEMFPTKTLRDQKRLAIADNRYSVFAKEMECKLISSEKSAFLQPWLRYWDDLPPKGGITCISIDPVPPPSPKQIASNLKTKDYEAISVVTRSEGNYFLRDYRMHKGHEPDWTVATIFELVRMYRPHVIVLEMVAAQRYLEWMLRKAMERQRLYIPLKQTEIGGKSKFARITTALVGVSTAGKFFVSKRHTEFITQFTSYGIGYKGPDDLLESVANGVAELTNPFLEMAEGEFEEVEDFPRIEVCP